MTWTPAKPAALLAVFGLAAVLLLPAGRTRADAIISGPPCVMDGNTLQVGGKMKDGQCWGGITVRLHGSIAPSLTETCTDSRGDTWNCGAAARAAMLRAIRLNDIACYHLDGEFDGLIPLATCLSGRNDLSMLMVRQGLAKMPPSSQRYSLQEQEARKNRLGLWR